MAVLKQTSPTACPVAPRPKPSRTVPSASTTSAVGFRSVQPESSCLGLIWGLDRPPGRRRQRPRDPSCHDVDSRFLHTKGASVLRENINNAVKDAMKARDERRVGTLRMMN